jgi:hypothetical protein
MSGCGGDSTGPGNLDSNAALQSLKLGMGAVVDLQPTDDATLNASFEAIAPILDQVNVTIDGKSQTVFAFGFRTSFPVGTCEETIFPDPLDEPGVCTTSFEPEVGLILWQSHSASAPPDRLIFITADVGTSDFDFSNVATDAIPAVALYLEGEDNLWASLSGTLTSQVAATNQSCGLPLPPFAKAGSCSVATFDEQGTITFESFSDAGASTSHLNLTIPRQIIRGLWLTITEVQPVTLP